MRQVVGESGDRFDILEPRDLGLGHNVSMALDLARLAEQFG